MKEWYAYSVGFYDRVRKAGRVLLRKGRGSSSLIYRWIEGVEKEYSFEHCMRSMWKS
jgi:hypothetical protein